MDRRRVGLASIVALACATSILARLGPDAVTSIAPIVIACAVGTVAGLGFLRATRSVRALSHLALALAVAGCFVGGMIVAAAWPFERHAFSRTVTVTVESLGEHSPGKAEIWFQGVYDPQHRVDVPGRVVADEGWRQPHTGPDIRQDTGWLAARRGAKLTWRGTLDRYGEVRLTQHAWSGVARVIVGNRSTDVDLFSETTGSRFVSIPVFGQTVVWMADVVVVSALLFIMGIFLVTRQRVLPPRSPNHLWLVVASILAVAWSGYLAAFWPAVMTSDSLDQWNQMTAWRFENHHPVFHTLFNWVLTRIWRSPATISIVQLIAFACAVGVAAQELRAWGASAISLAFTITIIALSPAIPLMAITLWKDVPYSICLLGIATFLLWYSRVGLRRPLATPLLIGVAAIFASAALFRHNGIAIVGFILVVLFVVANRRVAVRLTLFVVAVVVLIRGPLYRLLDTRSMHPMAASSIQIHQLGALAASVPDSFEPSERELMNEALDFATWQQDYACDTVDTLLFGGKMKATFFQDIDKRRALTSLWWRKVRRHPGVVIRHLACVGAIGWRINPAAPLATRNEWVIEANGYGLAQSTFSESLHSSMLKLIVASRGSPWVVVCWRPALWLYAGLFAIVVAMIRRRDWRPGLWLVPALASTGFLLVINVAQDFRYQFPSFLMGILAMPLVTIARDDHPAGR